MLAKRVLAAIAIGLGFLSTTSQVIILRELLVAFTGNELTLATTLATWLLSVAAGCFIFKRAARAGDPAVARRLFIIAAPTVVFQVILVRFLDPLTGTLGEIISPLAGVGLAAAVVAPGGAILGGLFVGLVAIAKRSLGDRVVSLVYGYEAIGSAVAGAVLSVFLLEAGNSFASLAVAGLVSLACAGCLVPGRRALAVTRSRAAVALCSLGLVVVLVLSGRLDLATRQVQWQPLHVEATDETRYGNLLVTGRDGLHDFFQSGSLSHTVPDPLSAEESAHIPLLYHPDPRRVLVIGGAGSGIIGEIGKHPSVRHIDFVELDPDVIRMTGRFAPQGWLQGRPGTEVTAVYGDGRKYVETTSHRYDVVILSVGLPVTLQTARYYTLEFFRAVGEVLGPEGVLAFKVPSGGAYLGPELGALLASLKNACEQVYGKAILLPGDYIHVIASRDRGLPARTDSLPLVLAERRVETSFVDRYRLFERLNPVERAGLDSAAASYDTGEINSDSRPVSATYAIARWAKHFESGRILAALVARVTPLTCVAGLLVSAGLFVPLLMRAARSTRGALPGALVLFAMGLTVMFTQVLIIVTFQIVSGYVYAWIAALIAAFMLGMGLASSLAGTRRIGCGPRHLAALLAGLAVLPLAARGILGYAGSGAGGTQAHLPDIFFVLLAFAAGCLGGTTFAAASAFLARGGRRVVEAGVLAYSLDLCGATVAGFTTGFLIIPSLGIEGSAYAVTAFDGAILAALSLWILLRARKD